MGFLYKLGRMWVDLREILGAVLWAGYLDCASAGATVVKMAE